MSPVPPHLIARIVAVLRPEEVFTITRGEFEGWRRSLGTLAEIVASTGFLVYGG